MTPEDGRTVRRARYARLLEKHQLASYDRTREVLEKPLGHLPFSLYQGRIEPPAGQAKFSGRWRFRIGSACCRARSLSRSP